MLTNESFPSGKCSPSRRISIDRAGPRLSPMYFIGDSNVLIFSHLCVSAPTYFAAPFVGRSLFCPHVTAADLVDDRGELDERVVSALLAERLAVRERDGSLTGAYGALHAPEQARAVVEVLGGNFADIDRFESPALVLMAGTLDLAWILSELGPNVDFMLDHPRYDDGAFAERARVASVPVALVRDLVRSRLARVGPALRILGNLGFDKRFVHSIAPPAQNDARYFRMRGIATQASVRSKVALLVNDELAAIAPRNGATFLDLWDDTVEGGTLSPRYALDGDHFNRAAALFTMERVLDAVADRPGRPVPLKDHALLAHLASGDGPG